jgi:hypothetical protein
VTILAVGGVLFPALLKEGYRDQFSLGLLTVSGSLGLLLPPSLPLILYAVVAQIPIEDLFIGGLLPGVLLTAMIAAWGVHEGVVAGTARQRFRAAEAGASLWAAKWELAMPAVVIVSMFSGIATAVEAAALTACYAFFIQAVVHRDLHVRRDLLRVFVECAVVIGGVLVILGVAVGLTNYLVGVQLPAKLVEWVRAHIESRIAFLLVAQRVPSDRGLVHGDLRRDRRRGAADRAARRRRSASTRSIWASSSSRTWSWVPDTAGRAQHLSGVVSIQAPGARGLSRDAAVHGHPRPGVLVITYVPWLTTGLLGWFGRL